MRNILRRLITIVLIILVFSSSIMSFSLEKIDDNEDVSIEHIEQIMEGDNILIIGDFAFDLNKTVGSTLTPNNIAMAMSTVYQSSGDEGDMDSLFEYYHKSNNKWINVIDGQEVDYGDINGNGKIKFFEMQKPSFQLPDVLGNSDKAVTDLQRVKAGTSVINDNKLGFMPPESWDSKPDDFRGWLMMYSKSNIIDVWNLVSSLDHDEIATYTDTNNVNMIFKITNYNYANGGGNTFRVNQKDVIDGSGFNAGLYNFYVATYTDDGVEAIVRLPEEINKKPSPQNLQLEGEGMSLSDYSVNFSSEGDDRIIGNALFYSKEHTGSIIDTTGLDILSQSYEDLKALENDGRLFMTDVLDGSINFQEGQVDIVTGEDLGKGVYHVYVVAFSENGALGLSQCKRLMITEDVPEPNNTSINDGMGTVVLAGGHTSSSDPGAEGFYHYIKTQTSVDLPRIAIFSSSRVSVEVAENHYYVDDPVYSSLELNYTSLGFEPVYIPLAVDTEVNPGGEYLNYVAESDYWAGVVKTCDAVFLQGGNQAMHAKSLIRTDGSDTKVLEAIKHVYNRGGVVAGTSAGMHILSDPVFGFGSPSVVLQTNETEVKSVSEISPITGISPTIKSNNLLHEGAGLVPSNILTDTHFDARGRLGRLIVALRDSGDTIGIGADESTALAITGSIGEVVGHQGVFIVDVRNASYEDAGSENTFGVSDVVVHYLTEGDKYDFDNNMVIFNPNKTEIVESAEISTNGSSSLFDGDYGLTKAIINFANSDAASVVNTDNYGFSVTFEKDTDTEAYYVDESYESVELESYSRTSVKGLKMDIREDVSEIPGVKTFRMRSGSTVTMFIDFIDSKYEIDANTINKSTVTMEGNTMYSSSPSYSSSYNNIKVSVIVGENYEVGTIITIDGIADVQGNPVETQSWMYDGSDWIKQ